RRDRRRRVPGRRRRSRLRSAARARVRRLSPQPDQPRPGRLSRRCARPPLVARAPRGRRAHRPGCSTTARRRRRGGLAPDHRRARPRDARRPCPAGPPVSDRSAELDPRLLRRSDTLSSDVSLIAAEFLAGFQAIQRIDRPAVSIFGSARIAEETPTYEAARHTARLFAEAGLAVVTGGGPGVMEAANRGAREGGGLSVGFNILLPHEQ